jgi:hypothetical protein
LFAESTGKEDINMSDKSNYIEYKYFGKSVIMADEYVSVSILSYLERLGFPMHCKGTYAYKDLILMVCDKLKVVDQYSDKTCLKLISLLKDSESELYRRLSLDLEISLDCLNLLINEVISKINYDVMDERLLNQICEDYSYELNYGELAFVLASMVLGYKREKKSSKIKIRGL